jgi:hypothetical protein
LPGDYVALTARILEMNPSSQHDGDLHELRALTWFNPTRGRLELTRPTYSSIRFGLCPAASMIVGDSMIRGMKRVSLCRSHERFTCVASFLAMIARAVKSVGSQTAAPAQTHTRSNPRKPRAA